uniref:LRRCT domain-containing protein n=1 Tax=Branchiostoma floridae TaxID=7739 RepID=C3XWS6_BRAFL|eukprot:XP_002611176.1 hypothetical protein BRAFLDRAFT_88425 [Branchiostoma floridae]
MLSAITPLAFDLLPSSLWLNGNPWLCDCKMSPFKLDSTKFPSFKDQIICTQPADLRGKKLTDVNHKELVCEETTISALPVDVRVTFNECNSGTTAGPTTGPEAGIALIGTVILTTLCKRRTENPASDLNSGHDNEYEDIDKLHNQAGQGQSQAIIQSNPNTKATVVANDDDHQCEDIDKHRNQKRQGQSQAITQSNPNTTVAVVVSNHDHEYEDIDKHRNQKRQGHSQSITQSNTENTTAAVVTCRSAHDHEYDDKDRQNQTRQGQSHTKGQPLKFENLSHDEVLAALKPNPMYTGMGAPSKDQTSTAMISGHGQTGQGQSQAIIETRNQSYGTGQIESMQSPLYKVVGQPQAIAESNTNTKVVVEVSDHDQSKGQGQSQAIIEARNPSYGTGQIDSMQSPLYKVVGQPQAIIEPNTNPKVVVGQGHPQAIIEVGNPSYGTGQIESMQSPMYNVVGQSQAIAESNTYTVLVVELQRLFLLHNQITMIKKGIFANLPLLRTLNLKYNKITMIQEGSFVNLPQLQALFLSSNQITIIEAGQGQSQAVIEARNPSYGTGQIDTMQSPMYKFVGQIQAITDSNPNTTAALMTSGHDPQYDGVDKQHNQTGQGQSQAITQSNPNTTTALMTSVYDHQYEDIDKQHNQTGQGQSQAITDSNPNTTVALMTSDDYHQYEDVDKQHNQTEQGQSQAIIQIPTQTPQLL